MSEREISGCVLRGNLAAIFQFFRAVPHRQSLANMCFKFPGCFYLFPRAVITKYHQLRGSNNSNLLSPNSGAWMSGPRGWQGWFLLSVVEKNRFHSSLPTFGDFLAIGPAAEKPQTKLLPFPSPALLRYN